MDYIEIINFKKYQHYSDKSIVWIKWYKKCLQDFNFCQLNNGERWLFVGLVLLASNDDGYVTYSCPYIRDSVMYSCPNSVALVRYGLAKMVKIGLIRVINSRLYKIRIDKIREEKTSSYKKKPYYDNLLMVKQGNKWFVIPKDGGKWLEFSGKESDIVWK